MELICKICNIECKSIMSLVIHLRNIHKIKPIEYYDKYIKKENEGKCIICQNDTSFISISKGYNRYCSTKCSYVSNDLKEKRKQTFIDKYGVENPGQNKEIKKKIKNTNIEKYGGTGFQIKELAYKSRKTHYEKYGCEFPLQNKNIKNKIKKNNIEKYGCENVFQNEEIKKKIKQTNIEKYGVENPSQNKEIKEKIKNTNIEKYGCEFLFKSIKIKEKIKQTNLEKYDVEYNSQRKEIQEKIKCTRLNNFIPKVKEILENLNLELLSDYNNESELIRIKCKVCNSIFETIYSNLYQNCGKCPNCFPPHKSSGETELSEFIKSIETTEILINNRKIISPYELDIFIPDKNIAIEFDGLYYHSKENGKDNYYHLNKTKLCEKYNIQLIHIFEDEWIYKQEIVKSRLKQILGLNDSKIVYARKCEIKEISPQIKNEFLNKYHIQGEDKSNIKLGSFYDDELISVMTFSRGSIAKGSRNINNTWELNRFCSNYNYRVIGIASKMLEYFKKNYEWNEIFSYADRRWSLGNLYKKIGFQLDSITKPNYWYIKNGIRIHRFNLRKRPNEAKDIPEWVLRQKEGYYKIYDCGHYKFKISK